MNAMPRVILTLLVLAISWSSSPAAPTTAPATRPSPTTTTAPSNRIEITDDPTVLLNATTPPDRFTLRGVGIGDDAKSVPQENAEERFAGNDMTWFHVRGGVSYLVRQDKVARLRLSDRHVLDRLGISDEATLLKKFGRPDEMSETGNGAARTYIYARRGIVIQWSPRLGGIAGIVVGNDAV